jgi:hypothetical protein
MRASSISVARIVIEFSTTPGVKCRVFQQPASATARAATPGWSRPKGTKTIGTP